jgi:hypothetical protein
MKSAYLSIGYVIKMTKSLYLIRYKYMNTHILVG